MNEWDLAVAKIVGTETAGRPEVAGLLGLWHFWRKEYQAAFAGFFAALPSGSRWGFLAIAAWRAEWGAKPLLAGLTEKAPLAAAGFWAWAGKGVEGLAALEKTETEAPESARTFLKVYLELLSLPPGPFNRPVEFRERLQAVIEAEHGVRSDSTRNLLALYDSGDLSGAATGLRPSLERFFTVPPFCTVDYLWLLFLTGTGRLDFASLSAAVAELESLAPGPFSGWKENKRAAGQLLLYFFMLQAGLESFEKALQINPKFARAAKNAELVRTEKPELVDLIKQFPIW